MRVLMVCRAVQLLRGVRLLFSVQTQCPLHSKNPKIKLDYPVKESTEAGLPINELKIDYSFVRDIAVDKDDAAIVQTIIAMAHNLGLEVVAEGVETEEQREFLKQHGCCLYQGYLFSRPVPLAVFETLLTDTRRL